MRGIGRGSMGEARRREEKGEVILSYFDYNL